MISYEVRWPEVKIERYNVKCIISSVPRLHYSDHDVLPVDIFRGKLNYVLIRYWIFVEEE
jgi:hypothetical protein